MSRGALIALVALVVALLCGCGITSACTPSSPGYTVVHHHYHHDSGHSTTKRSTPKPKPKPTKTTKKKSLK